MYIINSRLTQFEVNIFLGFGTLLLYKSLLDLFNCKIKFSSTNLGFFTFLLLFIFNFGCFWLDALHPWWFGFCSPFALGFTFHLQIFFILFFIPFNKKVPFLWKFLILGVFCSSNVLFYNLSVSFISYDNFIDYIELFNFDLENLTFSSLPGPSGPSGLNSTNPNSGITNSNSTNSTNSDQKNPYVDSEDFLPEEFIDRPILSKSELNTLLERFSKEAEEKKTKVKELTELSEPLQAIQEEMSPEEREKFLGFDGEFGPLISYCKDKPEQGKIDKDKNSETNLDLDNSRDNTEIGTGLTNGTNIVNSGFSEIFYDLIDTSSEILNVLTQEQLAILVNLWGSVIIIKLLNSITILLLGEPLLKILNLDTKYPKVGQYIRYKKTIIKFCFYIACYVLIFLMVFLIVFLFTLDYFN